MMKMKKMITGGNTGSEIDMKSLCNCKFQIRDFLIEYNITDLNKKTKFIMICYAIFIYSIS